MGCIRRHCICVWLANRDSETPIFQPFQCPGGSFTFSFSCLVHVGLGNSQVLPARRLLSKDFDPRKMQTKITGRALQRKSPKKSLKHQRLGCLGWGRTAGRTYMLDYNYTKFCSWTISGGAICTSRKILSYKSYGKGAVSIAGPSIHFCFCHAKPGRSMGVNCSCAEEPPIQGAAQAATWFLLLPQNDLKFQCQIVRLLACSWHFCKTGRTAENVSKIQHTLLFL